MICETCKETILFHAENTCPKCGGKVVSARKAKGGAKRPPRKTPEQKAKAKRRRAYESERRRKSRGTVIGKYVVECDGLFKRDGKGSDGWDKLSIAKIYSSIAYAKLAVKLLEKGVVMTLKEAEGTQ